MGLLSSLFGGKTPDNPVFRALDELVDAADAAKKANASAPQSVTNAQNAPAAFTEEEDGPSGFSWGPKMPDEPNQYNYPGSYRDYFMSIYRSEFADYEITEEIFGKATVLTFRKNGQVALIVELLSRTCGHQMRRRQCRQHNIPYLRYYYDYDGWWNTRAYVIQRTRNALNG